MSLKERSCLIFHKNYANLTDFRAKIVKFSLFELQVLIFALVALVQALVALVWALVALVESHPPQNLV